MSIPQNVARSERKISTRDKLLFCDALSLPVWSIGSREEVAAAARTALLAAHPDKSGDGADSPTVEAVLRARKWAISWIEEAERATVPTEMDWSAETLNLTYRSDHVTARALPHGARGGAQPRPEPVLRPC